MEFHATTQAALAAEAVLRELLAPELVPLFDASFIRSYLIHDEFIHRLVLRVAIEAGLEGATREPGTAEEIVRRAKLDTGRALVPMDWILRLLAARGVLDELPAGPAVRFCARGSFPALDPAPLREEQSRQEPTALPAYVLAETVAREYPAFLRGEVLGEDVLFSARRLRLWIDYFSNDNRLYAINNRVGAIAVEQWLAGHGPARVLELGGGLGSGALALLDRLETAGRLDAIAEYRFTEFVPAFLRRGEQALRARSRLPGRLTFALLDMNRPFAEQGVAAGSMSMIYAVNTLHVAHDLEFTLGEIRRALAADGRLIASECVRPRPRQPIYTEFVFNLTETFRSPRLDPVYRPTGGFLTPEQWKGAIEAAGFSDVCLLPDVVRIRELIPDFIVAAIGATRAR